MIVRWIDVKNALVALENSMGWIEVDTQEDAQIRERAWQWLKDLEEATREAYELDQQGVVDLEAKALDLIDKNKDLRKKNAALIESLKVIRTVLESK